MSISIMQRLILVVQPLPTQYLNRFENYAAVSREIAGIAQELNAVYLDYNGKGAFNPVEDFYDEDHLTAFGVKKYNRALIEDIAKARLFPAK